MSKKEKLVRRFLSMPSDFHFDEMVMLLKYYGFNEIKTGKTSGSRVRFRDVSGAKIIMHKPHPSGNLKQYQLKQIKEQLGL